VSKGRRPESGPRFGFDRLLARLPPSVNRALGIALTARLAQFVEAFLAVLLISENGASTATVAVVLLAQQAGSTLGAPLAGEMLDRRGAREGIVGGLFLGSAAAIGLAVLEAPWALVALAAIYGLATSAWRLAIQAGVAQGLSSAADRAEAGDLRSWAFGSLIWASNAGALVSACAATAGAPLRLVFIVQGALGMVAALMAFSLPRWRADPGPRQRRGPRLNRGLVLVAVGMAPSTILMFQAFSGLAIIFEESDYLVMVMVNAAVLVLAQPVIWAIGSRIRAGEFLGGATAVLGVGLAAAAIYEDVLLSTLAWSFAELVILSLGVAVVAGLAPHGEMGRYQATYQVIQGAVAALAMFAGPLLAAGSRTDFAVACLALGLIGAVALRLISGTLSTALSHPVACPCGAQLCRCDAGHLNCASPTPVIVHQSEPT
jgi:MFS family permease